MTKVFPCWERITIKKLVYITFVDYDDTRFRGVQKKIDGQIKVLRDDGFDVTLIGQYKDGAVVIRENSRTVLENSSGAGKRRFLCDAVLDELEKNPFAFSYFRFQFFCPQVVRLLKKMKEAGVANLMEIPTYPYEGELRAQGARGIPKLICDRMFRKSGARYLDRFVTLSDDDVIYGTPTIRIINGTDTDLLPVSNYEYDPDDIRIISVSSMLPWHGIDRIIEGFDLYRRNGGKRKITAYIVGDGGLRESLEADAKSRGLDDCVVFCGAKYGSELDEVFDRCCVGISSLADHRKGLASGSPLKTIECLCRGLGIVTVLSTDFVTDSDNFSLYVPADDTPLDVEAVIGFCDRLFAEGSRSVRENIVSCAKASCDMHATFKPVVDYYNGL